MIYKKWCSQCLKYTELKEQATASSPRNRRHCCSAVYREPGFTLRIVCEIPFGTFLRHSADGVLKNQRNRKYIYLNMLGQYVAYLDIVIYNYK